MKGNSAASRSGGCTLIRNVDNFVQDVFQNAILPLFCVLTSVSLHNQLLRKSYSFVRFEFLAEMLLKFRVLWDVVIRRRWLRSSGVSEVHSATIFTVIQYKIIAPWEKYRYGVEYWPWRRQYDASKHRDLTQRYSTEYLKTQVFRFHWMQAFLFFQWPGYLHCIYRPVVFT